MQCVLKHHHMPSVVVGEIRCDSLSLLPLHYEAICRVKYCLWKGIYELLSRSMLWNLIVARERFNWAPSTNPRWPRAVILEFRCEFLCKLIICHFYDCKLWYGRWYHNVKRHSTGQDSGKIPFKLIKITLVGLRSFQFHITTYLRDFRRHGIIVKLILVLTGLCDFSFPNVCRYLWES